MVLHENVQLVLLFSYFLVFSPAFQRPADIWPLVRGRWGGCAGAGGSVGSWGDGRGKGGPQWVHGDAFMSHYNVNYTPSIFFLKFRISSWVCDKGRGRWRSGGHETLCPKSGHFPFMVKSLCFARRRGYRLSIDLCISTINFSSLKKNASGMYWPLKKLKEKFQGDGAVKWQRGSPSRKARAICPRQQLHSGRRTAPSQWTEFFCSHYLISAARPGNEGKLFMNGKTRFCFGFTPDPEKV